MTPLATMFRLSGSEILVLKYLELKGGGFRETDDENHMQVAAQLGHVNWLHHNLRYPLNLQSRGPPVKLFQPPIQKARPLNLRHSMLLANQIWSIYLLISEAFLYIIRP